MSGKQAQEVLHALGNKLTALSGKVRKAKKNCESDEQTEIIERANELVEECVQLCIELRQIEKIRLDSSV